MTFCRFESAIADCLDQQVVVFLCARRVDHGERRQGIVEGVVLAYVSRDHSRISRARVGAGKSFCAKAGVLLERALFDKFTE